MFLWRAGLDLSNFNTTLVKDMRLMFFGCENLKSLDISNFYFDSSLDMSAAFISTNLKYINIYNATFNFNISYNFLYQSSLETYVDKGLMVCQKEQFITGNKATKRCCHFDVNSLTCNFIALKHSQNALYKNGFKKNNDGSINPYRNHIDYLYTTSKTKLYS